jgi:alkanesulfonate monooxygenase SsuD/methylene tetrahydromethanopterin reductase-like flavin-dependent oxidoreductase (luciferase family)
MRVAGLRLGVLIVPDLDWPTSRQTWQRAEELGFDHVWTYDHLAWRSLRDSPWHAAVPTLAAAACVTTRIRLGTLVASPNFRHPVPLSRESVTLDHLSGGRFTLGMGAGAYGWDATMLGQAVLSPPDRADRFAEFVELMDTLLTNPATDHQGRFYVSDGARRVPGCVQQPRIPFAVAATGTRGIRLAVRFAESWVTTGEGALYAPADVDTSVNAVRQQIGRADEMCAAAGRDPASLGRMVVCGPLLDAGLNSVEGFRDTAGRYAEAGVTDLVVHWPRTEEPYAADLGTFERIFAASR